MTARGTLALRLAAAGVGAVAALALLMTANAASDVKFIPLPYQPPDQRLDCQGHPRIIVIQNQGDSAQDLTGWKLRSDKPEEVFNLDVAETLAAGETMIVANGHNAPQEPYYDGNADTWTYGWNPTEVFDPSAFVLEDDGQDFLQIIDAGGNEVDWEGCPLTLTRPSPSQQAQPTQPPSTSPGGGSNEPEANQQDNTQTGGTSQSSDNSVQTVTRSRTTAGDQFGPPAPGTEAPLPEAGGPPPAEQSLPPPLMIMIAGAALLLGGVFVVRLALARPNHGA